MYGSSFLATSLISMLAVIATCLIVYECLRLVWAFLPRLRIAPRLRILLVIIPVYGIHIINIWLYAGVFFLVENFTTIGTIAHQSPVFKSQSPGLNFDTFLDCIYFSAATYTSLGFGDFLPMGDLRMLSAAEVLNGLILIGWTVSFTYLAMEKFWASHVPRHQLEDKS